MKWTVSLQRTMRQGRKWQAFIEGEKETGKRKNRKCIGNNKISIESRVGLAFGDWLIEYHFWPRKAFTGTQK